MSETAATVLGPKAAFEGERRETFRLAASGGSTVGATLHLPLDTNPSKTRAAVLLLPGWSGPRTGPAELLAHLAMRLAQAGHVCLRIDLTGRGDAEGAFADGDLDRMIDDAAHGLRRLREAAPGAPLAAGGLCSGANVALGLASLPGQSIGAVLAYSPLPYQPSRGAAFDRRRRWKNLKQYARKALQPATWGKLLRGEVNIDRVKKNVAAGEKPAAGERNLKDSARDIERELLDWKGRALFLWGSADEEAAPARAHFEGLHAKGLGQAQAARFETVEGANHNSYAKAWREDLIARSLAFLNT